MENKKERRGRPKKYSTIEEIEATKQKNKEVHSKKTWFCDTCGRTYKSASKLSHLNTKKHKFNDYFFKYIMRD